MPDLLQPDIWRRAHWFSVGFIVPRDSSPALGLVFQDHDYARAIFTGLVHGLGAIDRHERLRVSIIEGDLPHQGSGFSVHVGHEVGAEHAPTDAWSEHWLRLTTRETGQLRRFKEAYARHQRFILVPAAYRRSVEFMPDLGITKERLWLRQASDVGRVGDPDAGLWQR
jgi:hypothetical protein